MFLEPDVIGSLTQAISRHYERRFSGSSDEDKALSNLVKLIKANDIENLDKEFKNQRIDKTMRWSGMPLLFVVLKYGDIRMLKLFLDNGFDIRDKDQWDTVALHLAVWCTNSSYRHRFTWNKNCRETQDCYGCTSDPKLHSPEQVDVVLDAYGDDKVAAITNAFMAKNKFSVTPFLLACAVGCDAIIMKFLSLLDKALVDIPMDMFMDKYEDNIFHYIIKISEHYMTPVRVDTLKEMLEKLPHVQHLLKMKANEGFDSDCETPVQMAISDGCNFRALNPLAIRFIQHAASFDDELRSKLFLYEAIDAENPDLVEALLKAGCDIHAKNEESYSALSYAVFQPWEYYKSKRPSIRIIELLLAYGFDLQKELYLYTMNEKPIEYSDPENAKFIDIRNIQPDILDALRKIRRSNAMFSLKNQCRSFIRRHLKRQKVDEMIEQLDIPVVLKRFLKVEDDLDMLGIKE